MATERRHQLVSIQILRAVAALLVVCMHEQYGWSLLPAGTAHPLLSSFGQFKSFGGVGVQIFFIVSGFIMAHLSEQGKTGTTANFMADRFSRLAPLYWLTSTIWLATRSVPSWSFFFESVLFIPVVGWSPFYGLGWSLTLEAYFYVTFGLIVVWLRASVWWMVLVFAMFAVLAFLFPGNHYFTNYGDPVIWNFVLGLVAQRIYRYRAVIALRYVFLIVSLALFAHAGYTFLPPHAWGKEALLPWTPPAFLFVLFFLSAEANRPFRSTILVRCLKRIGDASYSLYLTHFVVIFFANGHLLKILEASGIKQPDMRLAIFMCAAVGVSLLCYRFVEMPMTRVLRKAFSSMGNALQRAPWASKGLG